jgi:hypothetical protein
MRVFVKPNSRAEALRHPNAAKRRALAEDLAPGFEATPQHDLRFRGGRTIAHLNYVNFFVGGFASWDQSDVDNIGATLAKAMSDSRLNNVIRQYFANQDITTTFLATHFVGGKRPKLVTQTSAEKLIADLFAGGQLSGIDFPSTVINLMLPSGTVLTDGTGKGNVGKDDSDKNRKDIKAPGTPESEEASSLSGLGGYHGSVDLAATRIYYAVGVYSQRLPSGGENGIVVFDIPWKNVVATFYHELNEARTDPDVEQAIKTNVADGVIGWNSDDGEECGDFPVFEAGNLGNLALVFQEVHVEGGGTAPVQFQYSDAVHGPEGPIAAPHSLNIAHEMQDAVA